MIGRDLYDLRTRLRHSGIVLCYSGSVNEAVLSGIGQALKQRMAVDRAGIGVARRVFGVFVEQMQNMIRYSAERQPAVPPAGGRDLRHGVIAVGRGDVGFVVEAGNLVRRADVPGLRRHLEQIRDHDRRTLLALYKRQLRAGLGDPGSEAGVGFIEIARRASRPIEFGFVEVDEQFCFFTLRAEIRSPGSVEP
jgi:hypothetical protein